MPVPEVYCEICREHVTKRSTLALSVLGAGQGRACRSHEVVAQLVQACAADAHLNRELNAATRKFRIMAAAAGIRVAVTIAGASLELIYLRLRIAGYDGPMLKEIREEVDRLGGPMMTSKEIGEAIFTGITLAQKVQKGISVIGG